MRTQGPCMHMHVKACICNELMNINAYARKVDAYA